MLELQPVLTIFWRLNYFMFSQTGDDLKGQALYE